MNSYFVPNELRSLAPSEPQPTDAPSFLLELPSTFSLEPLLTENPFLPDSGFYGLAHQSNTTIIGFDVKRNHRPLVALAYLYAIPMNKLIGVYAKYIWHFPSYICHIKSNLRMKLGKCPIKWGWKKYKLCWCPSGFPN